MSNELRDCVAIPHSELENRTFPPLAVKVQEHSQEPTDWSKT